MFLCRKCYLATELQRLIVYNLCDKIKKVITFCLNDRRKERSGKEDCYECKRNFGGQY